MALVQSPYCAPGTCYHYSNTNFVILGHIVELITGQPIARAIQAQLLDPLGLADTYYQPNEPTPADAAHGFVYGGSQLVDVTGKSTVIPTMSAATVAGSAGAMVSSATDLAHWATDLYGGGVVAPDLLAQMETTRACYDYYGLGTRERVFGGRIAYGHLGSLRGYVDAMWYFPAEQAAIVVLSNGGQWQPDGIVARMSAALFSAIGAPPPELSPTLYTHSQDQVTLHC